MERIQKRSPQFQARIAGVLYLVSVLTAVFAEFFAPGKLGLAAILIPVAGYSFVTLLVYGIVQPVNRSLALLAVGFGLGGLALEAVRWHPRGVNIAVVMHGFYCLLIGYLIFRSTFLPRILGALMVFAGLGWLTFLSNPLVNRLSPYNLASGLLGEASLMLWLLIMGVNEQRWKELASTAEHR